MAATPKGRRRRTCHEACARVALGYRGRPSFTSASRDGDRPQPLAAHAPVPRRVWREPLSVPGLPPAGSRPRPDLARRIARRCSSSNRLRGSGAHVTAFQARVRHLTRTVATARFREPARLLSTPAWSTRDDASRLRTPAGFPSACCRCSSSARDRAAGGSASASMRRPRGSGYRRRHRPARRGGNGIRQRPFPVPSLR